MKIGKLLKVLRINKGLTQTQMAKAFNISQNYLSLIEQGKRIPSNEAVINFARFLGISKEALVILSSNVPEELSKKNVRRFKRVQRNLFSSLLIE